MAKEHKSIRQFLIPPLPPALRRESSRLLPAALLSASLALLGGWGLGLALVPVAFGALASLLILVALRLTSTARNGDAMAEARLMALTARIRPHFLFNSLNAVLGTIRTDPRRAESALEELSTLFRALLQDPRHLVPLSDELSLCRKYLALERLRLGDRLQVRWDIDRCPPDALVPPLVLQPLLENAVYHGIEPASQPAPLSIRLVCAGGVIAIELGNPLAEAAPASEGNRLAMANIRERLRLFYGHGAELMAGADADRYLVRIVLPYQRTLP